MTWRTAFTDVFGIDIPIALAPMGGSAGGALAARARSGRHRGRAQSRRRVGARGRRALVGTRFLATPEALVPARTTDAILAARGEDTERSVVLDVVRRSPWPSTYSARTLGHPFLDAWRDRPADLLADEAARVIATLRSLKL